MKGNYDDNNSSHCVKVISKKEIQTIKSWKLQ